MSSGEMRFRAKVANIKISRINQFCIQPLIREIQWIWLAGNNGRLERDGGGTECGL